MLRAERGAQADAGARIERIEAVEEVAGDRCGMGDQRNALAFERGTQCGVGEQAVDTEQGHAAPMSARGSAKQASWWKSGRPAVWAIAQWLLWPFRSSITAASAIRVIPARSAARLAVRLNDPWSPSVAMAIWAGISR